MSIFEALVLGLVQGLTEFIPVSSSGHLLLVHEVFGSPEETLGFDVALHVGTLLALLLYFRVDILSLARSIRKKTAEGHLARLLITATIPAAFAGLFFSDFIEDNLRSNLVVACTLAGVGILMLYADARTKKSNKAEVTTRQGLAVGFAQVLALIPGVSRSGITMTTGILSGMSREAAARFSFLLAIPIISGSAVGIFLKNDGFSEPPSVIIVGVTASFISGFYAIRFLLGIIKSVGLRPFAVYRIILAVIVFAVLVL